MARAKRQEGRGLDCPLGDVGLRVVLASQVAEVPLYAPLADRLLATPFNLEQAALDWLAQGRPDGLAS